MATENLTQAELDERIAILHRFRTLLEQQRTKFREYLKVLEMQESKISEEDAEALLVHSELENQIVEHLGSLQKVIVPMQQLYIQNRASTYNPADIIPIEKIQNDLANLQTQVLAQNQKNQLLLKNHISDIRQKMLSIQNPYRTRSSIYAEKGKTGVMIQIDA